MANTGQLRYNTIRISLNGNNTDYNIPANATITDIQTITGVDLATATLLFNSRIITDVTACPIASVCLVGINVSRPEGGASFDYRVDRTSNLTDSIVVNWSVIPTGSNPVTGADFGGTLPSGVLNFTSGVTMLNFSFGSVADFIFEDNPKTFQVQITTTVTGGVICNNIPGTILDSVMNAEMSFHFRSQTPNPALTYQTPAQQGQSLTLTISGLEPTGEFRPTAALSMYSTIALSMYEVSTNGGVTFTNLNTWLGTNPILTNGESIIVRYLELPTNFIDAGLILTGIVSRPILNYGYIINLSNSLDSDFLDEFSEKIIDYNVNVNGGNSTVDTLPDIYFAVRTNVPSITDNWTTYLSGATNTARKTNLLNTISALPNNTKYAIHTFIKWNNITPTSTVKITPLFATSLNRVKLGFSDSFRSNNYKALDQVIFQDGINDVIDVGINNGGIGGEIRSVYTGGNLNNLLATLNPQNNFTISVWHWYNGTDTFILEYQEQNVVLGNGGLIGGAIQRYFYAVPGYVQWQANRGSNVIRRIESFTTETLYSQIKFGWNHYVWVNRAVSNINTNNLDCDMYINGRRLPVDTNKQNWDYTQLPFGTTAQTNPIIYSAPLANGYPLRVGGGIPSSPSANDPINYWMEGRIADFLITSHIVTPEEVRVMYNKGTNISGNYTNNYPNTVLSNRILHYTFNTPEYTVNTPVGNWTISDLSSNNNTAIGYGQGSNPFLVGAYS